MNAPIYNSEKRALPQRFLRAVLIVCTLTNMLVGSIRAQTPVNGDFESSCLVDANGAFQSTTDCVTGPWRVSHGSPDIHRNVGVNATATARMWADDTGGEGLFIECPNFIEGVSYTIRLSYYPEQSGLDHIYIALCNGLTHSDNPSYGDGTRYRYPTPTDYFVVADIQNPLLYETWESESFSFTPDANYSQLWIYPKQDVGPVHVLMIDDVYIYETASCSSTTVYTNFAGTPALTEVSNYIQASGTSAVSGTQQITYKAGNYIKLQPNFHATPTSTGFFHAYIVPCVGELQSCSEEVEKKGSFVPYTVDPSTALLDNTPNPFTGRTVVSYVVEKPGSVTLTVVNILGAQVAEIVHNNNHSTGRFSMDFDASHLAPGVYYLRLTLGETQIVKKMIISP